MMYEDVNYSSLFSNNFECEKRIKFVSHIPPNPYNTPGLNADN